MPSLSFDFSQTYALQIDPYWRYSNTTGTGQYIWGPLSQNVRAMTVADLNGDGLNDLIAFPTYFNEGGTPGPSIAPMVLFNDGGGHWTEQILILPDIHVGSPNSVFTFSWNGSTYIFVADQGMETGDPTTFPYSHNWLISYDAGTHTFVDETHLLPNNALAFNHLSWAGHVSSMSNFDVLVPNLGGDNPNVTDIGGGVRWYEFTPGGVIDKTSSLPTEVQESEDRFTFGDSDNIQSSIGGVTVSDLNSDGYSDLVTLGYSPDTQGTFDSIRVFEGTASGFSNSPVIMQAPSFVQESHYFSGATDNRTMSAVQAFAADIEGTGRNDLIVLWEGAGQDYIQILRNNGSFSFADVTSSFFGGITPYFNGTFKDAAGNWSMTVSSIEVKDINGDGRSDLLIHGYNSAPSELASGAVTQDFIYLNHAGQYFAPYDFTNLTSDTISTLASNTAITAWQTGIPLIADVTGDGVPDLATVTPSQTATTTVNDNIYSDFYDLTVTPGVLSGTGASPVSLASIQWEYLTVTRSTLSLEQATSIAATLNGASETDVQYAGNLAPTAKDTTSAILSIFEFMGATADSASLTVETNLISSINNQFSAAAGWVAIGASLADSKFSPKFAANYENLSTNAFISAATQQAFGTTIDTPALQNELAIYQDFFQHYPDSTDPTGSIRARGGFIADMLHQASDYALLHPGSPVGSYEQASQSFLVGLVEGTKTYGQSIFA